MYIHNKGLALDCFTPFAMTGTQGIEMHKSTDSASLRGGTTKQSRVTRQRMKLIGCMILFLLYALSAYSQNEMYQKSDSIISVDGKEYYHHTVQKGETAYSLSKMYEIAIETLYEHNPNAVYGLRTGEPLLIPILGEPLLISTSEEPLLIPIPISDEPSYTPTVVKPEDTEAYLFHVVKRGETVYSISKNYGVRIDSLLSNNKKIVDNQLSIGDTLIIPTYKQLYDFIEYRAEKKESLMDIANRFQLSLKELKARNPHLGNNVAKNDIVLIPVQKISPQPENPSTPATETPVPSSSETFPELTKSKDTVCHGEWDTEKKYTVALILPFSASKLASVLSEGAKKKARTKIDAPSLKYLYFYQGVTLALDSLAARGLNICLNVYDINTKTETEQLLEKYEMQKTDLIICAVAAEAFKKVADFSKQHDIPVVNIASQRNDILQGYPNVAKIVPEDKAVRHAAQQILPENGNSNILIIRKNATAYSNNVESLKTLYPHHTEFLSEGKGMSSALSSLDAHKPNFVFMFSENTPEILDLMRVLDEKRKQYDITLIGFPNWNAIEKLDYRYAQNLKLHFIVPQVVDYKETKVQEFISLFRARFNNDPDLSAFQGYDIAYNFLDALGMFGISCLACFNHRPHHFLSTGDIILNDIPGNGYNNQYWNIYTVQEYEVVKR